MDNMNGFYDDDDGDVDDVGVADDQLYSQWPVFRLNKRKAKKTLISIWIHIQEQLKKDFGKR